MGKNKNKIEDSVEFQLLINDPAWNPKPVIDTLPTYPPGLGPTCGNSIARGSSRDVICYCEFTP